MNSRIVAACLALVLVAPSAYAESRVPSPVVRDHRTTGSIVRDHRSQVSSSGASGGVVVTKTKGAKRRPACVNNVCRNVVDR